MSLCIKSQLKIHPNLGLMNNRAQLERFNPRLALIGFLGTGAWGKHGGRLLPPFDAGELNSTSFWQETEFRHQFLADTGSATSKTRDLAQDLTSIELGCPGTKTDHFSADEKSIRDDYNRTRKKWIGVRHWERSWRLGNGKIFYWASKKT